MHGKITRTKLPIVVYKLIKHTTFPKLRVDKLITHITQTRTHKHTHTHTHKHIYS